MMLSVKLTLTVYASFVFTEVLLTKEDDQCDCIAAKRSNNSLESSAFVEVFSILPDRLFFCFFWYLYDSTTT